MKTIGELIELTRSSEPSVAGKAARELLGRHSECVAYISEIVDNLDCGNAAIEDLAFRTLERMGPVAAKTVIERLSNAETRRRMYLLSLLPLTTNYATYFPLLQRELEKPDIGLRFHAANCIGRCYNQGDNWPKPAIESLNQAAALLQTARSDANRAKYWAQARMTLKQLGRLEPGAT